MFTLQGRSVGALEVYNAKPHLVNSSCQNAHHRNNLNVKQFCRLGIEESEGLLILGELV